MITLLPGKPPSWQPQTPRLHRLFGVVGLLAALLPACASAGTTAVPDILTAGLPLGTTKVTATLPPGSLLFDPASVQSAILTQGDVVGEGVASWYGGSRWAGRRTASGRRFNPNALTAASATLPLGTRVLVRLEGTARSVIVTITDRLGAVDRVIDLSKAAARRIGIVAHGTARVLLIKL